MKAAETRELQIKTRKENVQKMKEMEVKVCSYIRKYISGRR
jgi:hypothetical protein